MNHAAACDPDPEAALGEVAVVHVPERGVRLVLQNGPAPVGAVALLPQPGVGRRRDEV